MSFNPSVPPPAPVRFAKDKFEEWMLRQARIGHDRNWLARNEAMLRERHRGKDGNTDLPFPDSAPLRPHDRYGEV